MRILDLDFGGRIIRALVTIVYMWISLHYLTAQSEEENVLVTGHLLNGTVSLQQSNHFAVDLEEGDLGVFILGREGCQRSFDPLLQLLGPTDDLIAEDSGNRDAAVIFHRAVESARYGIRVREKGDDHSGCFGLMYYRVPRNHSQDGERALVSGEVVDGTLGLGAVHVYSFEGTEGATAILSMGRVDNFTFSPQLQVFGPDGSEVDEDWGSQSASLEINLQQTGTYYAVLSERGGDHAGRYQFVFHRIGGPSPEDGERALVSGEVVDGTLGLGAVHVYSFEGTEGATAILSMGRVDNFTFSPQLQVFGPDGSEVDEDWGSQSASLEINLQQTGTYYAVLSERGGDHAGRYQFVFHRIGGPSPEDGERALVSGEVVDGTLGLGAVHVYSFEGTEGATAILSMGRVDNFTFSPQLQVFGPDGSEVDEDWGSQSASLEINLQQTGTYYAVLSERGGDHAGRYQFVFHRIGGPSPEDGERALVSGEVVDGTLGLGAVHVYSFEGTEGELAILNLRKTEPGSFRPQLQVFGPSGKEIGEHQGSIAASIEIKLKETGRFYAVVRDQEDTRRGHYSIGMLALTNGPEFGGLINLRANETWLERSLIANGLHGYWFESDADDLLHIDAVLSGLDSHELSIEVFDPSKSKIGSGSGSVFIETRMAGIHYAIVKHESIESDIAYSVRAVLGREKSIPKDLDFDNDCDSLLLSSLTGSLFFIDCSSKRLEKVETESDQLLDIAMNPRGGLFGVRSKEMGSAELIEIDRESGAVRVIGRLEVDLNSLEFDSVGTLYGAGSQGLYRVDQKNLTVVKLHDFLPQENSAGDIAIGSDNELYYWVDFDGSPAQSILYRFNTKLGFAVPLGLSLVTDFWASAFLPSVGLLSFSSRSGDTYAFDELSYTISNAGNYFGAAVSDISGATVLNIPSFEDPAKIIGPVEYSVFRSDIEGVAVSPFSMLDFSRFVLEDFEDGLLNVPGVRLIETEASPHMSPGYGDSVDGDDGILDGRATGPTWGLSSAFQVSTMTFQFSNNIELGYPTHAGIVWTDVGRNGGGRPRSEDLVDNLFFEAFGAAGELISSIGPMSVGDMVITRTASEDRFLGVACPRGVSAIRISMPGLNNWEVDHLQFGWAQPVVELGEESIKVDSVTMLEDEDEFLVPLLIVAGADSLEIASISYESDLRGELINLNSLVVKDSEYFIPISALPDAFGMTEVYVRAVDMNGKLHETFFRVDVLPVNDQPTLDPIENQTILLGNSVFIRLEGIGTGALNENDNLRVFVELEAEGIVDQIQVDYDSPNSQGILSIFGGRAGDATVRVIVDDGGAFDSRIEQSFRLSVSPSDVDEPLIVSIEHPEKNASFIEGETIDVLASASDGDDMVTEVAILMVESEELLLTDSDAPYSVSLQNLAAGRYSVLARARNARGEVGVSDITSFQVHPNSPPHIGHISDQVVTSGNSLRSIVLDVSDDETPLSLLKVEVVSLEPERLPGHQLEVVWSSSGERVLQTRALTNPSGNIPYPISVTVTDEHGSSVSTEFSLTVANELPRVHIIHPENYDIVSIPKGSDVVDVQVRIGFVDDQQLGSMSLIVDGEPGVWVVEAIRDDKEEFAVLLSHLGTGEYQLIAEAADPATGKLIESQIVRFKVVDEGEGEIAIVHPRADYRQEVFTVWNYLDDLGYQPKAFFEEEATVDELASYQGVIWHDLGVDEIRSETVDVLWGLQQEFGTPLYIIGENLVTVQESLEGPALERWTEITKLSSLGEKKSFSQVQFLSETNLGQGSAPGYWAILEEFSLGMPRAISLAQVDSAAEIVAISEPESNPLVLRYPSTSSVDLQQAPRRFVQRFPVLEGGRQDADYGRRALFENALCYLLAENIADCECESAEITKPIAQQTSERLVSPLGRTFHLDFSIGNNGRCSVRGGQLVISLPAGLNLVNVESSKGVPLLWDEVSRLAYLAVGTVEPDGEASAAVLLSLEIEAASSGLYVIGITSTGSNSKASPRTTLSVLVEGIQIDTLERSLDGTLELLMSGSPEASGRLEWTNSLDLPQKWQLLEQLQFPHGESSLRVPVRETIEDRFFRVIP